MDSSSCGLRRRVPCKPEEDGALMVIAPTPADAPSTYCAGSNGGEEMRWEPPAVSASSSSSSSAPPWQRRGKGVRLRGRRRREGGGGDDLQDLGLSLGMSFAAVISQILDGKIVCGGRIPAHRLSTICSLAVKEAVENVYGNRLDNFTRNFEKSFCSTLKTLQVIQEENLHEQRNQFSPIRNYSEAVSTDGAFESSNIVEDIHESYPQDPADNQLVLREEVNQQLAHLFQRSTSSGFNQSVLSTLEKSVVEQTRSNDLKAIEIGLIMRKIDLKKSQLDLTFYASFLERIKISMGISKSSFKEEKLKNQIRDFRHAELHRRCMDLLVTGLILMCCLLVYGAYAYSYRRISEATSSCMATAKEPRSWWVPKQVTSFSSGWHFLRCHVVIISRMFFGILMILAVAYSTFQRSASSGSAMPVTFILLLLGVACGTAGKFCVDTLGGNGYFWLLYWEIYCLVHFLANAFPAALYHTLYGPVAVCPEEKAVRLPYWFRRISFYTMMVIIFPMISGLMPFASIYEWQEHLSSKTASTSFRAYY